MPAPRTPRPAVVLGLVLAAIPAAAQERPGGIAYDRDVQPILAEHCATCHGPDAAQRKAGLRLDTRAGATARLESGVRAIVPGDPDASALLTRVQHPDPGERMPPADEGEPLTGEEIAVLRAWIADGARYTTHWSFVPPQRPELPPVEHSGWPRNPIDRFVLARLEAEGMAPSPPADRATLCRRLHLTLTGLPPSLAELDAFLAAGGSGACRERVEALLLSPAHAEHLARYWLDAARYGDTHGLHLDNERSIWPWRDHVIAAFADNQPFDEFTVEQLAGDLLPEPTRDQLVATGFNRCNPTSAEGGMIAEEYRALYAFDRTETVAEVWMGLTMTCARCHDHKYDPVTQREYYGLLAFFNSFDEKASDENALLPPPSLGIPTPEQEARRAALDAAIAAAEEVRRAPHPRRDAAQLAWEHRRATAPEPWTVLEPVSALSEGGATLTRRPDRSVLAHGRSPAVDAYELVLRVPPVEGVRTLRVEALPSAEHGGAVGRAGNGNFLLTGFRAEVAREAEPLAGRTLDPDRATASHVQKDYPPAATLDGDDGTGWAIDRRRTAQELVYRLARPLDLPAGGLLRCRLVFGSRFDHHTIGRLRVSLGRRDDLAPLARGTWRQRIPAVAAADGGPAAGAWQPVDLPDARVHTLPATADATVLERVLDSPGPRPVTVMLGSRGGLRVRLDGEVVHERTPRHGGDLHYAPLTLHLHAGGNRLELEVTGAGEGRAFYFRLLGEHVAGLPLHLDRILRTPADLRPPADRKALRRWFRRRHDPDGRRREERLAALRTERQALERAIPRTLITRELDEPRPAHVLERGVYDRKGEVVPRGVPSCLPPLPPDAPRNRLGLARWLVSGRHPLTARVTVNRLWQIVFGRGLVATPGNLGVRGAWPSHPRLLDWLAVELVDSGWDRRHLLRLMVTSATYRQSSCLPADGVRDRDNVLLARGPRFRLDAEPIRDQALQIAGLLVEEVGGPGVKPYQPPGLWQAVGYTTSNTARFERDSGAALYRRSLYTFWKRTSPPPALQLFDAPSRETCTVERPRTNTPLQALVLLNDVQHVETARAFAERTLHGSADDRSRLVTAFRRCTARRPGAAELAELTRLLAGQRDEFAAAPDRARALIRVGASEPDPGLDPAELAAWTVVTSTLLNLHETITQHE